MLAAAAAAASAACMDRHGCCMNRRHACFRNHSSTVESSFKHLQLRFTFQKASSCKMHASEITRVLNLVGHTRVRCCQKMWIVLSIGSTAVQLIFIISAHFICIWNCTMSFI
jgi:hypothetical protein